MFLLIKGKEIKKNTAYMEEAVCFVFAERATQRFREPTRKRTADAQARIYGEACEQIRDRQGARARRAVAVRVVSSQPHTRQKCELLLFREALGCVVPLSERVPIWIDIAFDAYRRFH